jgi:1,2-diacylglycerol 3-alpha-glucosyltransferase
MNIVMMTNTYFPIVGGLEKSVASFSERYQKRGHRVLIVAPDHPDAPEHEIGVFRVPAIQYFNGTDFSVELPISTELSKVLTAFGPDIIHTHHPFLIGDTALRAAAEFNVPIVFTHHTLYERNTHYVGGESVSMKRFVISLSTGFANLCDLVIAPTDSVAMMLEKRGVTVPVKVAPTGIDVSEFNRGRGQVFRKEYSIPSDAFLAGIVSRVSIEKNFVFLAEAMVNCMRDRPNVWFVIIGEGPLLDDLRIFFDKNGLSPRFLTVGFLQGRPLANAYAAMDVFVFASHSETQGLVMAEAMAAGVPVLALHATGAKDIINDGKNGWLIPSEDSGLFTNALHNIAALTPEQRSVFSKNARETSKEYGLGRCVTKVLSIYREALQGDIVNRIEGDDSSWLKAFRIVGAQRELMRNLSNATGAAFASGATRAIKRTKHRLWKMLKDMKSVSTR